MAAGLPGFMTFPPPEGLRRSIVPASVAMVSLRFDGLSSLNTFNDQHQRAQRRNYQNRHPAVSTIEEACQ